LFDRYARPRFVPGEEVDSTKDLRDHFLQKANPTIRPSFQAFQFCSAEWGTVALECVFPSIAIKGFNQHISNNDFKSTSDRNKIISCTVPQAPVIHGVFTYCLIHALQSSLTEALANNHKEPSVTFQQLYDQLLIKHRDLKKKTLKAIEQVPTLRIYSNSPRSIPNDCHVFWPFSRLRKNITYHHYIPNKVKNSPIPYIPDQEQWLHTLHVQNYLDRNPSEKKYKNNNNNNTNHTSESMTTQDGARNANNRGMRNNSYNDIDYHPLEMTSADKKETKRNIIILKDDEHADGVFQTGFFSEKRSKKLCNI